MNTPEVTAQIAAGLMALADRNARLDRRGPVVIAAGLSPVLAQALKGAARVAGDVTRLALERARYGKPLPLGLGETAATLCEAISQAMRHIAVAVPPEQYQDRLQLSRAATFAHNVYCQFAGPLRNLVTYASLEELYGATLSSNAMGGRPLSPLRYINAFQYLVDTQERMPIEITTDAAASAMRLTRSDPVLQPLAVDTVASYLSDIANGAVAA